MLRYQLFPISAEEKPLARLAEVLLLLFLEGLLVRAEKLAEGVPHVHLLVLEPVVLLNQLLILLAEADRFIRFLDHGHVLLVHLCAVALVRERHLRFIVRSVRCIHSPVQRLRVGIGLRGNLARLIV